MPTKVQAYSQMADHAATQLTGSHRSWMEFLQTAARLYKYPYHEQLMIYAQRPEATACAEYDFWNDRMGRYVRRGSKGIALIDNTGDKPRLKYVFDVADTGTLPKKSRNVNLWTLQPEHTDAVSAMLEQSYDIKGNNLADSIEMVAAQLADEYWNDHQRDIFDIVEDSFLEEYDDFNIGVQFRSAATVSITYALMSRCGLAPEEHFEHEDFLSVFDFNTPQTVAALGTAVSTINQQVLRQIEVTIRNYERSMTHGTDLHQERGLSDSRPEPDRAAVNEPWQVREDAQELPSGAPPDFVEQDDYIGNTVSPPAGNRADGAEPLGAADAEAGESGRRDREPESSRSDEVDRADEQLQGAGGGNDTLGTDFQLTPQESEPTVTDDWSVEGVPVVQLIEDESPLPWVTDSVPTQMTMFPTEGEQISFIEQAESVAYTPFAFSFPQGDIDHVLRLGGNNENSRQRVAVEYMKQKPIADIATFLSQEYVGGGGFKTDSGELAAWYAEDGIHLARGRSAQYVNSAQIIPWEDAATRIGELLEQGQFAGNVELAEADGYSRRQLAQSLWYLRHDFSEAAIEQGYLSTMEDFRGGGFPDETAGLAEGLSHPEYLSAITAEYAHFLEAYHADKNLLRFRNRHADAILTGLQEQALPWLEYSTQISELPQVDRFITEDEINAALTYGSNVEGSKGRIYSYFSEKHTPQEQIKFLKEEYGWGGHNGALPGSFHSFENHDGKGIELKKPECVKVQMPWSTVAKRIAELIRKDRYFTPQEHAKYEELQSQHADIGGLPTPLPRYGFPKPEQKEPEQEKTPPPIPTPRTEITQEDIDTALQAWNGDAASKQRVAEYMANHAREKDTATWLSREYGGTATKSLFITVTGTDLEIELPWTKVQRRLAQLINENNFLSEQEALPLRYQVVIYHHLENGFDEKLEYRALQEAEKVAQGYVDGTLEADGFAYDGAAIYDLQDKKYLRIFGDYPDDAATQLWQETTPIKTAAGLDLTDADLQDILTGDGGLLDYLEKDKIGGWLRDGDDNVAIAQRMGDAYAGTAETMTLLSGETADYFASANGLAINIHDKFSTHLSFGWNEIAPVLRAMYEQERDGFSHEPTTQQPELPSLAQEAADYEAERMAYRQKVLTSLTPEQQRIVEAMELGGFPFRPTEQTPIYFGDYADYPTLMK